MIYNKELYSFDSDPDPVSASTPELNSTSTSTTDQPESITADDSAFHFFNNLLYQTIVATCFLIMVLIISHSSLTWTNWAYNRLHSAVEATQQNTFGRISQSQLWQNLIGDMSNMVRLEEITKKFERESFPRNYGGRVFLNSVWPVQGSITKGYGWQYNSDRKNRIFNSGMEITALPDTLVLAIADGTVSEIIHQTGRGWQLVINHGNGWSSSYNYLGLVKVKVGQKVKAGDTIAQISRPDQEQGSILWLEIKEYDRPVDPLSVLAV
jgi:murein DD-endopeptidase MepM/ murein hydrolase activator NlpD